MADRFWPILGLDEGASEAEVRRAYAKRLREQGPEADVAIFQALRDEFEAALTAVRSGSPARTRAIVAGRSLATRPLVEEAVVHHVEPRTADAGQPPRRDELPRFDDAPRVEDAPRVPEPSSLAVEEITGLLAAGDLVGACNRFDSACASNEIDFRAESEIELELAHHWLTNTTLNATALAAIVRRYRWDDVVGDFSLGPQIVARLHAATVAVPKPGERFIGKWNWGAFCLTPFWLMAHGLRLRGIRVLALGLFFLVVPLLGPFGLLWIAIDYGKKGNALAVRHRSFSNEAQFVAVQNAWRNWGLSVWAGTALCLAFALVWVVAKSG